MTIAKQDIIDYLNTSLEREETNLDTTFEETLIDLCIEVPAIAKQTALAFSNGDTYKDLPANFRDIVSVRIGDGEPLDRINSWEDYLELVANETVSDRSEPLRFIVKRVDTAYRLYLHPTPDASYNANTDYHEINSTTTSIALADRYKNALKYGCCFFYLLGLGEETSKQGQSYWQLYQRAILQIKGLDENAEGAKQTLYQDI
jgi:hypothetical protein